MILLLSQQKPDEGSRGIDDPFSVSIKYHGEDASARNVGSVLSKVLFDHTNPVNRCFLPATFTSIHRNIHLSPYSDLYVVWHNYPKIHHLLTVADQYFNFASAHPVVFVTLLSDPMGGVCRSVPSPME